MKNYLKIHNQNPTGKDIGDCYLRAISYALDKDYYQVKNELNEYMIKYGYSVENHTMLLFRYLLDNDYEQLLNHNCKTVKGFLNKYEFDSKVIIFSKAHVCAIDKDKLIDTGDSSLKRIYTVGVKKGTIIGKND